MLVHEPNPDPVAPMVSDEECMRRAILIGEQGRTSTAPNPWVGCVIAKAGRILSEGFHVYKGGPHAEVEALQNLKSPTDAHGSTVYVTLEPCCHYGSTPPCAEALIKARVARVFVAIGADPDSKVNGGGTEMLRHAGIEVITGLCEEEARHSLRAYLHHRKTGRCFVVAKVGTSMNGLVAFADGSSKWITSEKSREQAMRIRHESQAILVGISTVLKDDPRLTLRGAPTKCILSFLRCVIDPSAKLGSPENQKLNLCSDNNGPVLVFTQVTPPPPPPVLGRSIQIEWVHMPEGISIRGIFELLGQRGCLQVLVEGGANTLSRIIHEKLLNELTVFVAPTLIGSGGLSFFNHADPSSIDEAQTRFELVNVSQVVGGAGDVRIEYRL